MSNTLERNPCSFCKSSDNLVTWIYEEKQFQKCKTPNCENSRARCISNAGSNTDQDNISHQTSHRTSQEENVEIELVTGEYQETRGLTLETCQKLGIQVQGDRHIFLYNNSQKVRYPKPDGKKGMFWQGNQSKAGFFGDKVYDKYNYTEAIIFTEGEFDAGTLFQCGYQSLSNNSGSGGADQEIKERIKEIEAFKEVILWFDNDDAGRECLKKVLGIDGFPLYKTRIIDMSKSQYKDANEMLEAGAIDEIHELIKTAPQYKMPGIVLNTDLTKEILLKPTKTGLQIRIEPLNTMIDGLAWGKLILVGGGSNIGKTPFVKKIGFELFNDYPEAKIANIYLEENIKETGLSYIAMENKVPIDQFIKNPLEYISQEKFDTDYDKYINSGRLMFTDEQYTLDSAQLFKNLDFLYKKGYNIFMLDHISLVIDASTSKEGERKDIDRFMQKISAFVKRTQTIVIAACHLSNPSDGIDWEEGREVRQKDFRGSGALRQYPHIMIGIERNLRGNEKMKSTVRIVKNRGRGHHVGHAGSLHLKEETGELQTLDNIFKY